MNWNVFFFSGENVVNMIVIVLVLSKPSQLLWILKNPFCWLESLFDDFPDEKKNPIEDDFLRIQNPHSHPKPVMGKIGASKSQSFTSCGGKCDRLCNFFRGVC